jgi:lipopolysaccharide export system permease protein
MKTSSKPQNLYYIFISIISSVVIYYFKDLSLALGQTDRVPLVLSVWIPIIAISLFCCIGIIQINEK